jgi:hypothetical protein
MAETDAWGRPRDAGRLPPPRRNGYWTQEIYYHLLDCGLRLRARRPVHCLRSRAAGLVLDQRSLVCIDLEPGAAIQHLTLDHHRLALELGTGGPEPLYQLVQRDPDHDEYAEEQQ